MKFRIFLSRLVTGYCTNGLINRKSNIPGFCSFVVEKQFFPIVFLIRWCLDVSYFLIETGYCTNRSCNYTIRVVCDIIKLYNIRNPINNMGFAKKYASMLSVIVRKISITHFSPRLTVSPIRECETMFLIIIIVWIQIRISP